MLSRPTTWTRTTSHPPSKLWARTTSGTAHGFPVVRVEVSGVVEKKYKKKPKPEPIRDTLDGIDGKDVGAGFLAGAFDRGEDLGDDEAADTIVEGPSDEAILAKGFRGVGVNGGVPYTKAECGNFFGIAGANVDVEFVYFWGFFAVSAVPDVNGGVANDT